jgi:glutathione S-transferase
MKLYDSIGPNPRTVRMFAAEKGIELSKVTVDLMKGENRQGAYAAKNPSGTTPALELDNGLVLAEITAICEYLDEIKPGTSLIGKTPRSAPRHACGCAASISTSSSRWPTASATATASRCSRSASPASRTPRAP